MERLLKESLKQLLVMKFIKQISLYTFVGLFGTAVNFFVMPVLSHYLSPADYGLLSLFNAYVTILVPLVSLSAYSLLNVDYFKEKDKQIFASKFTSIQTIPFFTSLVCFFFIWQFYKPLTDVLELNGTTTGRGLIMLLITFLTIYYEQFLQFLILQKKAFLFAAYTVVKVIIEVALTFYFVIWKSFGWEGRIYSWLIASTLLFIIGAFYFYKQGFLKGNIKLKYIKEGIQFGSPLILHSLGKFVVNQSDRIFIAKMVSISAAGVYSIGYTIGSLVMILVNAYFNFYTPFLMERLSDITEEKKLQIVKMGYLYGIACILVLILIVFLTPVFFRLFIASNYFEGSHYPFWVALGYCFWGGYMLFSGFIFFFKKNRILGWLAVFNIGTNLLFNYLFIKIFGAIGAAYATALSFFLLFILLVIIVRRFMPLPWFSYRKIRSVRLY
jgi:O-antigen/teichoic acid export membrane protein